MEALLEYIPPEFIGGVEYTMSPTNYFHYTASNNLSDIIKPLLNRENYRLVQDVCVLPDDETEIFPDVAVFETPLNVTERGAIRGIPVFVAEILSPSTHKKDRTIKKSLYERIGVKEYWIVDPRNKSVEVYRLRDGYELEDIYQEFPKEEWNRMPAEEKDKFPHLVMMDSLGITVDIWDVFKD